MKALYVQKVAGISGSENYLLKVMPALKKKGITVDFLCLYEEKVKEGTNLFLKKLEEIGVNFYTVEVKARPTLAALQNIKKVIQKGNYSLVHTHLIHADFFLALVKAFLLPKLILISTKHGYDETYSDKYGFSITGNYRNLYWFICKWAEKCMNRSFAISHGLRNLFIAFNICKKEKIDLIHYGFDFSKEKGVKSEVYRTATPQLLIVGRLVSYKGHRFVIRAMRVVIEKFPEAKLVIVGDGKLKQELMELAIKEGVKDNVVFKGFQSNIGDYMFNSDILLVPSVAEGFGIVFLEAYNNEIPVVAFDVPAANEIIENNVSGILIKPYDVTELGSKLSILLSDEKKRNNLVRNAHNKLTTYFTLERMVDETLQFYKKLIPNP